MKIGEGEDLLAFGIKIRTIGIRQYVVESHQTGFDGLRLMLAAVPAVGVPDGLVEGLVLKMVDPVRSNNSCDAAIVLQ